MIGLLALVAAAVAEPAAEPSVMIIEFEPKYVGLPAGCGVPDGSICLAELYEGPVKVIRHLSGPPIRDGEIVRYQRHGQLIHPRIRVIISARPFEDKGTATKGYFAFWWDRPVEPGKYCVTDEELKSWSADDPVRPVFDSAKLRHFRPKGWDEADDFRCISD